MKTLFITHDTSRTGAPMVLLHFLRWLKQNKPDLQIDVLALQGGAMHEDFRSNCNNYFDFKKRTKKNKTTLYQRIALKLGLLKPTNKKNLLIKNLGQNKYDVIYANTIITVPIATKIKQENNHTRLIAHIHELDVIIKQSLPTITEYEPFIYKVIAPSQLVAGNLKNNWGFPSPKVETIYECAINSVLEIITINEKDSFTIGASGLVHWRKGYDVFIQLARYIAKNYSEANIDFVWVGKMADTTKHIIEEDLRKLGLQKKVRFTGEVNQPATYFNAFDVFVMTSREDPFPLVCIEVGQLGKPIISFEQATGTNEVIVRGGGFVVPYLDVEVMAAKVMEYYNDPLLKEKHGAINKKEFSQFTPAIICPQLFSVLDS